MNLRKSYAHGKPAATLSRPNQQRQQQQQQQELMINTEAIHTELKCSVYIWVFALFFREWVVCHLKLTDADGVDVDNTRNVRMLFSLYLPIFFFSLFVCFFFCRNILIGISFELPFGKRTNMQTLLIECNKLIVTFALLTRNQIHRESEFYGRYSISLPHFNSIQFTSRQAITSQEIATHRVCLCIWVARICMYVRMWVCICM